MLQPNGTCTDDDDPIVWSMKCFGKDLTLKNQIQINEPLNYGNFYGTLIK